MFARSLLTMLCASLLVGFLPFSLQGATAPAEHSQQNRPVSSFSNVNVHGAINVTLHTGYAHPGLILRGDPRDLAYVVTKVASDKLYVTLGAGYPHHGPVSAAISTRYLDSLEYHGSGTLIGERLKSPSLDAVIDNKGRTSLRGQIVLRRLVIAGGGEVDIGNISSPYLKVKLSGNSTLKLAGMANLASLDVNGGRISLYWVKSRALTVRGRGNTFIQLAGFVDILDVKLCGAARFNGRYLRANRVFVKTYGTSVAEISALRHQHALASDSSDIRFYYIPQTKANFMAFNGAVLDMRDLSLPFVQEYDEYNK